MTQREGTLDCSHCQKFNTVSHSLTHTLSSFLPSPNSLTPSFTFSNQTVSFTTPSFLPLKWSCINHNPILPSFVLKASSSHIKLLHISHHHSLFLPLSFILLSSRSLQTSSFLFSPHSFPLTRIKLSHSLHHPSFLLPPLPSRHHL